MVANARREAGWLTGREAARRLGLNPRTLLRFAEQSGIRRRVLQGTWTTYHKGDVDAILASIQIVGEGVEAQGGAK